MQLGELVRRNRQRDEVMRDVLQTAMGPGAGISKIMFYACLSHSQATAYLSQMIEDGLVVNDVEQGKSYYRTRRQKAWNT